MTKHLLHMSSLAIEPAREILIQTKLTAKYMELRVIRSGYLMMMGRYYVWRPIATFCTGRVPTQFGTTG